MTGQSSAGGTWWKPIVYQSTTSMFSIGRLALVQAANPSTGLALRGIVAGSVAFIVAIGRDPDLMIGKAGAHLRVVVAREKRHELSPRNHLARFRTAPRKFLRSQSRLGPAEIGRAALLCGTWTPMSRNGVLGSWR
jgi:hypothetical protein